MPRRVFRVILNSLFFNSQNGIMKNKDFIRLATLGAIDYLQALLFAGAGAGQSACPEGDQYDE
jgi:hypothetical protein